MTVSIEFLIMCNMYINYYEVSILIVCFFFLDWVFSIVFVKDSTFTCNYDEQMNLINETNPDKSRQFLFIMGTKG